MTEQTSVLMWSDLVIALLPVLLGVLGAYVSFNSPATKRAKFVWLLVFSVLGFSTAGVSLWQTKTSRESDNTANQRIMDTLTGGKSYSVFVVAPNTQPLRLFVFTYGEFPMYNVRAQIQTVSDDSNAQLRSMRMIPLGDGTLLPGPTLLDFTVSPGTHIITIWARNGYYNEKLEITKCHGKWDQRIEMNGHGKAVLYSLPGTPGCHTGAFGD